MMEPEKKEGGEEKKRLSAFFQHFSLRRRNHLSSSDLLKSSHGSNSDEEHGQARSWSVSGSSSSSSTPTCHRDRSISETTVMSPQPGATEEVGKEESSRPMSKLQRATSMIRRNRRNKEEGSVHLFFHNSNESNSINRKEKEEIKVKKINFTKKDKEKDEEKKAKKRSLTMRPNSILNMGLLISRSNGDDSMFRKGEPAYFIKELKKNASSSSSSSKRVLRGNRQVEVLTELKEKLRNATEVWVQEFVREPFKGVQVLLDVINEKQYKVQMAIDLSVQASCLECLRGLANTSAGLGQLMNAPATKKVASLLASRDAQIKGAALELLSFVCLVPPKGVQLVLDAMNHFRSEHKESTRFHSLVEALRTEESIFFLINALFFINSVVNSPDELKARQDLRREFITLGLMDIIRSFKNSWVVSSSELKTQIKVFEEEMHHDVQEERRLGAARASAVDKNSPDDIFNVVHRQVRDSPYYQSFTNAMGNMLQLSSTNAGFVDASPFLWSLFSDC